MPFPQFFVWNAMGGVTWGLTFGLLGYYGGEGAAHVLTQVGVGAAIALGVAVLAGVILLKVRERRSAHRVDAELKSTAPEPESDG